MEIKTRGGRKGKINRQSTSFPGSLSRCRWPGFIHSKHVTSGRVHFFRAKKRFCNVSYAFLLIRKNVITTVDKSRDSSCAPSAKEICHASDDYSGNPGPAQQEF